MADYKQLLVSSPSHFSQIWSSYLSDLGSCLLTDLIMIVFDPTSQSFIKVHVHQAVLLPLCPLLAGLVQDNAKSHPSIICEAISLPVLQCLLTLVYTGCCVLTSDCTLSDLQILMKNLGMDNFKNLKQAIVPADETHSLGQDCSQSTTKLLQTEVSGIRQLPSSKFVLNSSENKLLEPSPTSSPSDQDYQCKCIDCDKILPSPVHLIYHMHVNHSEGSPEDPSRLSCRFCQYSVKMERKDSLIKHLQRKHTEYKCSMCEEIFNCVKDNLSPFKRFLNHNSEKHQDKARFSFNLRLENQGEHLCTKCSSSFSSLARMYYHMATQHPEKGSERYKCIFCTFSIKSKNHSLLEHLMIHTGEKSCVCKFCGKKFRAKKTLLNHERLHTREKNFKCSKCDERFVQKSSLLCHLKAHDRRETENNENMQRALLCRFCGKEFKYGKALKNHMKLHVEDDDSDVKQECVLKEMKNKVKVFSCSTCPVSLPSRLAMADHERKHTQPTVWAQCGRCSGFYLISRGSCMRCSEV